MWWSLPGPDAAVTRIAEAIREGQCVLIEAPSVGTEGLRSAVRAKLSDTDVQWETLNNQDLRDHLPLDVVVARVVLEFRNRVKTASDLANHVSLSQKILWLEVRDKAVAELVIPFFCEFAHAANDREVYERPSLVIEHICADNEPPEDLRLANAVRVRLLGHTDWLDIRLFAAQVLRASFSGEMLDLAASVAASLAVWDADLVVFFRGRDLAQLLEPEKLLVEYWLTRSMHGTWRDGSSGRIGDKDFEHSSLLAIRADQHELHRRVWRGQIGPLFTFLEERRIELLERFGPFLNVPLEIPGFDPIGRVEDLEISHIRQLMDRSRIATREESWLLADLTRIRNRLAHLEPVTAVELGKPSLRRWWGDAFQ